MKIVCTVLGVFLCLTKAHSSSSPNPQTNTGIADLETGKPTSNTPLNPPTEPQFGSILMVDDKAFVVNTASIDSKSRYLKATHLRDLFINATYASEIPGNLLFYGGSAISSAGTALQSIIGGSQAQTLQASGLICIVIHGCLIGFAKVFARLSAEQQKVIDTILKQNGISPEPSSTPNVIDDGAASSSPLSLALKV